MNVCDPRGPEEAIRQEVERVLREERERNDQAATISTRQYCLVIDNYWYYAEPFDLFESRARKGLDDLVEFVRGQQGRLSQYMFMTKNWDPSAETRREFVDRAIRELKHKLDNETEYVQTRRLGQGGKRRPRGKTSSLDPKEEARVARRKRTNYKGDHYEWLVYYQVKNCEFDEISQKVKKKPNTVREGIEGLAKILFSMEWRFWLRDYWESEPADGPRAGTRRSRKPRRRPGNHS